MSELITWALHQPIPAKQKVALLALADNCGDFDEEYEIPVDLLVQIMHANVDHAWTALRQLSRKKLISVISIKYSPSTIVFKLLTASAKAVNGGAK